MRFVKDEDYYQRNCDLEQQNKTIKDKLSNLQRYEQTLNMANKEVTIELTEDPNGECVLWADIQEILDGES